ncbi:MAG TPA: hypothetical protein VMT82_05190 [candidate division Zixibacteria bacterium]|nr:hypothetical protein [candidate division Zixibacteria bacterium]
MKLLIGDNERLALTNAMEYALSTLIVTHLEQRVGMSHVQLEKLRNHLASQPTPVNAHFSETEVCAFEECLRMALAEMDEEDFLRRIGVEFSFAQALLATLRQELTRH